MNQVQINPESTARIYRQIADMLESPPEGVDFQRIKQAAVNAIRYLAADQVHHRQHLDEWRAEIARLHIGLAKPQWLPIETAPQDGTQVILGYAPDEVHEDGFVAPGRWHEEDFDGPDNMGHDAGFMDDQYQFFRCARSFGNPKYLSGGTQPTHWMPLPDAPEAQSTTGAAA